MIRVGEVTAVNNGELEITFCRPSDCAKCHGCLTGSRETKLTVPGTACVGDAAVVELPEEVLVKASFTAYIIPLAGLLAGAAVGSLCGAGDAGTAIGGLVGLGLSLGIVLLGEKKRKADASRQPVLREILPAGTQKEEE